MVIKTSENLSNANVEQFNWEFLIPALLKFHSPAYIWSDIYLKCRPRDNPGVKITEKNRNPSRSRESRDGDVLRTSGLYFDLNVCKKCMNPSDSLGVNCNLERKHFSALPIYLFMCQTQLVISSSVSNAIERLR